MKLWVKIFIGLVLGILAGLILGPRAIYLQPLGSIFLNLINMIIVLLILSSMTVGITSIHDPKKLGRIGGKTLGIYFMTTMIAILLGLTMANLFQVGSNLSLESTSAVQQKATLTIGQILVSMVPKNPFTALVEANMLQIIVFAVFLGIAINFAGERGKPLLHVMESLADVMYRLTSIIMEFSPIGVFGIMAWVTGTFGLTLLIPLFKFLGVYYLACAIHIIIYCGLLKGGAKLQIAPFFKGMGDAFMMAFSTGSSAATLPVAMHCVQENLGVSKNISSFVLPLGLTVNMNGTAIFQTMSAIFIAHAYGIPLDFYHYLTLVVIATLSAIGTAGVPGGGFVMLSAVLSSVGLPLEGLAILVGIDRLREMVTTVVNILGDAVVTVIVAKQEGELNERQYYHTELVQFESNNL